MRRKLEMCFVLDAHIKLPSIIHSLREDVQIKHKVQPFNDLPLYACACLCEYVCVQEKESEVEWVKKRKRRGCGIFYEIMICFEPCRRERERDARRIGPFTREVRSFWNGNNCDTPPPFNNPCLKRSACLQLNVFGMRRRQASQSVNVCACVCQARKLSIDTVTINARPPVWAINVNT